MLGDKSALYAQDLDIPLSTTGIMHTVAVSGLHLAFLLGFLRLFIGQPAHDGHHRPADDGCVCRHGRMQPVGAARGVHDGAGAFAPLLGRENDPPTSLLTALAILLAANPFGRGRASVCSSRLRPWRGLFCVSGALYRALDARLLPPM